MRAPPESFSPISGRADLRGQVHDLDNLGGVGFGKRAAEDGEVLREDENQAAFDASVAGDEAVSVIFLLFHAEIVGAMRDKRSVSSNVPSSSRNSIRSRADILPSLCWRSRRSLPPPSSARCCAISVPASFCSRFMAGIIEPVLGRSSLRRASACSGQAKDGRWPNLEPPNCKARCLVRN